MIKIVDPVHVAAAKTTTPHRRLIGVHPIVVGVPPLPEVGVFTLLGVSIKGTSVIVTTDESMIARETPTAKVDQPVQVSLTGVIRVTVT